MYKNSPFATSVPTFAVLCILDNKILTSVRCNFNRVLICNFLTTMGVEPFKNVEEPSGLFLCSQFFFFCLHKQFIISSLTSLKYRQTTIHCYWLTNTVTQRDTYLHTLSHSLLCHGFLLGGWFGFPFFSDWNWQTVLD